MELSIVLVILGLLVGGVLSGKSLIEAASIRSQINQIDGYRVAALTFREKYFFLPGDLTEPTASAAGFKPRGPYAGEGDGDGVIQGVHTHIASSNNGLHQVTGETALFWTDLSKSGLIPGQFTTATATGVWPIVNQTTTPSVKDFLPKAKLSGTSMYVYIGGSLPVSNLSPSINPDAGAVGRNYFFIGRVERYSPTNRLDVVGFTDTNNFGLKVSQAYAIDAKVDDGSPIFGKVIAMVEQTPDFLYWHGGGYVGDTTAASATTCSDNGNSASNPTLYSMSIDNGSNPNCTLLLAF